MSLETFKNGIKHRGFRFPKKHPGRVDGLLCFVGLGLFLMSEEEKKKIQWRFIKRGENDKGSSQPTKRVGTVSLKVLSLRDKKAEGLSPKDAWV